MVGGFRCGLGDPVPAWTVAVSPLLLDQVADKRVVLFPVAGTGR